MRGHLVALAAVLAMASSACGPDVTGLDIGGNCGFLGEGCASAGGLQLDPGFGYLLKGDTVVVSTVFQSTHPAANWSISGVGKFVDAGALSSSIASAAAVRVKALSTGLTTITATTIDGAMTTSGTYSVADSSTITAISFWQLRTDSLELPRGYQLWVFCQLQDAPGNSYIGRPTAWSSSDSTVAVVVQDAGSRGCVGNIGTRAAGEARITARFQGITATLRVYVRQ